MGHAVSNEDVSKQVKTYLCIFAALLVLTGVTVGITYFHLPVHLAIALALVVATIKGTLVALYFMHLNHEKKIIYFSLGLTVAMFLMLMTIAFYLP